jgi:hypothetical protein
MSSIATFWWHDDIVALQKQLDADVEGVNRSVSACTTLSDAMRASWQDFYVSVKSFTQGPAAWINTGTQADRGQELQRDLLARQQQISGVCANVTPVSDPDKGKGDPTTALKWAAVIVGIAGVAYVTAQVSSTVRLFKAPSSKG